LDSLSLLEAWLVSVSVDSSGSTAIVDDDSDLTGSSQLALSKERKPHLAGSSIEKVRNGDEGLAQVLVLSSDGVSSCSVLVVDSEVNDVVGLGGVQQEAPVPHWVVVVHDDWRVLLLTLEEM